MESKHKQTLLITGGAGYIGSVLTRHALHAGFKVNILDSLDGAHAALDSVISNPDVNYFQGNITDNNVIEQSTAGVDFVVHLAGISDGKAGKANPELTKKINVETLEQILQISKNAGVQRFIFASTMGVYGNAYKIPLTENLELKPMDPYSESKALGEEFVKKAATPAFTTTILRMAMVYGISPNMRFDFIVNRLTLDAIEKKQLTIMGGGQQRPQIHIDDLAELFLYALTCDKKLVANACFNAVGENPAIEDITTTLQKLIPDLIIEKLPARANEDSFNMDGNKLLETTAFKYKKNIETGIREMIHEYAASKTTH